MSAKRTSPGYYVAVVILGGLLIAGVALVVAMIARPGTPEASVLAVTDRQHVACQTERRGTSCFNTQVTNNGSTNGTFRCEVRSTDGSEVNFESGSPIATITLEADQSVDLKSVVVSTGRKVGAPTVSCEALVA